MNDHVPMQPAAQPAWRIADLARLLQSNATNWVAWYDGDGKEQRRSFPQVLHDALAVLERLQRAGCAPGPGRRCAIAGPQGYDWLLAALACILSGTEVVAVPESFQEEEARASLDGLPVSFAVLWAPARGFGIYSGLPMLELEGLAESAARANTVPEPPGTAAFSLIAFTSGSTAAVKVKSFRLAPGCTELGTEAFARAYRLAHEDRWAVLHSFSHVVHFEYALGGLCWGYNVILADPMRLLLQCASLAPAVLVTVPSVYEQLAQLIRRKLPRTGLRSRLIRWLHGLPMNTATRALARYLAPWLMPEVFEVVGRRLKVMIIGAAPSSQELRRFLMLCGLPVYEAYGMSETSWLAANVPGRWRFNTVGPAWPGVEIKLVDDDVIAVRLQSPRTAGYLNVPASESARTFLEDGWVSTGDIGHIEDGFVKIVGRAKEIIITRHGKNVNPASIESRLAGIPGVQHALVYGNDKPFLVALLAPAEPSAAWQHERIAQELERVNAGLAAHEQVQDYVLLDSPLSEADGLLTRSGKIRRQAIETRYREQLESLYSEE